MKRLIFFISILSLALFPSCDEDSFQQTVDIDLPEHESKLAITAIFEQDSLLRAYVSNSVGVLESFDDKVDGASFKLFENGNWVSTFEYVDNSYDGFYRDPLNLENLLEPGNTYKIEVSHPVYGNVIAAQVMPSSPKIDSVKYTIGGTIDPIDGYEMDEVLLYYSDLPNEENYYMVEIFEEGYFIDWQTGDTLDTYSYHNYVSSQDPLVVNGYKVGEYSNLVMITDRSFEDSKYVLRFATDMSYGEDVYKRIRLTSITEDVYRFQQSLYLYDQSEYNPFAEPVIVHNNIEGGYGIFGLMASDEVRVKVQ
jgi:hypothetical protein